jgi:hypothetical protein
MSALGAVPARALFINGTVGAGKTTTANEIGTLLQRRRIPHAVIDLDSLRNAWPSPPGDRFNLELELENLAAVATNFRDAGAEILLLAGVLEVAAVRARYEAAVGVPLTVCRLVVAVPSLRSRITARHRAGEERDWHLARTGELDSILEAAQVDDLMVTADDSPPDVIAARVLAAVGWV